MKNSEKGLVVPLLLVVGMLVLGGGTYLVVKNPEVFNKKNQEQIIEKAGTATSDQAETNEPITSETQTSSNPAEKKPEIKKEVFPDVSNAITSKNVDCGVVKYGETDVSFDEGVLPKSVECFFDRVLSTCDATLTVNNNDSTVFYKLATIPTSDSCSIQFSFVKVPARKWITNVSGMSMVCPVKKEDFSATILKEFGVTKNEAISSFLLMLLSVTTSEPTFSFGSKPPCTGTAVVAAEKQRKINADISAVQADIRFNAMQGKGVPNGFANAQDSARLKAAWKNKSLLITHSAFEAKYFKKNTCIDFNEFDNSKAYEVSIDGIKKVISDTRYIDLKEYITTDSPGQERGLYALIFLTPGINLNTTFEAIVSGTESRFVDTGERVYEIKPSGYCTKTLQ